MKFPTIEDDEVSKVPAIIDSVENNAPVFVITLLVFALIMFLLGYAIVELANMVQLPLS